MKKGIVKKGNEYRRLLSEISGIITQGKTTVLRQIDVTQVITYWFVGRRIVEFYQQGEYRAEYGEQILIRLSRDLLSRFGKGFSVDNLENMRRFYTGFPKISKISETVSRKSLRLAGGLKSETVSRILSLNSTSILLTTSQQLLVYSF